MLCAYKALTAAAQPLFKAIVTLRARRGKEHKERLKERKGIPGLPRPDEFLFWIHAASVGESQSALILMKHLLNLNPQSHILITTGTVSSEKFISSRLPERCIHQFYPLDHPAWVKTFLDHWKPDMALWIESELWPNMITEIKNHKIPAVLVNARMSDKSFNKWKKIKKTISTLLSAFDLVLCQTDRYAQKYKELGAKNVLRSGNIKYSAAPLPYAQHELDGLKTAISNRPLWLYASTHKGEETLACAVHKTLKSNFPDLLTIIVPRHPERKEQILEQCAPYKMNITCRSNNKTLPDNNTDIYLADTFGELGLFYRLAPVAVIGRSFSDDGGGGHNPIEAAQLECAVLYGPNVQYQQEIFDEMSNQNAALMVHNETDLSSTLNALLSDPKTLEELTKRGKDYTDNKKNIIDHTVNEISSILKGA